jgi:hypothetical protein
MGSRDAESTRSVPKRTTQVQNECGLHVHIEEARVPRKETIDIRYRRSDPTYMPTLWSEESARGYSCPDLVRNAKLARALREGRDDRYISDSPIRMDLTESRMVRSQDPFEAPVHRSR